MSRFPLRLLLNILGLIALATLGCGLAGAVATDQPPASPIVTVIVVTATSPAVESTATQSQAPGPVETVAPLPTTPPPGPTATSGPQCTVQQSLNLRNGPGTAYNPPLGALEAGTQLVPIGYEPEGIPGGSWVQVRDMDGRTGWVSAGTDFVQCNLDLSGLPRVDVGSPPPPPPPRTESSDEDGVLPENLAFEPDFNSRYFFRLYTHDTNVGDEDGDGITEVFFTVKDEDDNAVYEHSEQTAGYCIFGGGEPDCNPWVFEDFQYKWTQGGAPVEAGSYKLFVRVVLESEEEGNWNSNVEINLD